MIELKNCPNCGGILDDTGRCMYCKSKIYNLTDVNINLDSNDILAFKLTFQGNEALFYARPVNASFDMEYNNNCVYDAMGTKLMFAPMNRSMNIHMDFIAVLDMQDKQPVLYTIKKPQGEEDD